MKCYDARRKLSALLDRAVPEAYERAVLGHLDDCPACRAELEALARTDRALEKALTPTPPAGYFEAFYARISVRLETHAPELADVKTLARQTLERHAEKSAPEVPDALLSAAPSTLSQVVLPVPPRPKSRLIPLLAIAILAATGTALLLYTRANPNPNPNPTPLPNPNPNPPPTPSPSPLPPTDTVAAPAPDPAPSRPSPQPKPKPQAAATTPTVIPEPPAATPAPPKARDPILEELSRPAPPTPPPAAPSTGRDKLSHDEIKTGLDAVEPRVHACYEKHLVPGRVTLKLRITPDGRVADATPEAPFAGTDAGACVAAAVRAASFPAFDGAPLALRYTFTLGEE